MLDQVDTEDEESYNSFQTLSLSYHSITRFGEGNKKEVMLQFKEPLTIKSMCYA